MPVRFSGVRTVFRDNSHFPIDIAINNRLSDVSIISFQLDMFHEQLPLPVPCYDLLPVIEFAVVLHKASCRAPPTSLR